MIHPRLLLLNPIPAGETQRYIGAFFRPQCECEEPLHHLPQPRSVAARVSRRRLHLSALTSPRPSHLPGSTAAILPPPRGRQDGHQHYERKMTNTTASGDTLPVGGGFIWSPNGPCCELSTHCPHPSAASCAVSLRVVHTIRFCL